MRRTPPGAVQLEIAVRVGAVLAPLQLQQAAVGQHHLQSADPLARGAVLEGRRARGVGGRRPADARALERRHGRVVGVARRASAACNSPIETPAWAVMPPLPAATIRSRRRVVTTTSPIGVAPPVNDDCAPTGSTRGACRSRAPTSAAVAGCATPAAWPPG